MRRSRLFWLQGKCISILHAYTWYYCQVICLVFCKTPSSIAPKIRHLIFTVLALLNAFSWTSAINPKHLWNKTRGYSYFCSLLKMHSLLPKGSFLKCLFPGSFDRRSSKGSQASGRTSPAPIAWMPARNRGCQHVGNGKSIQSNSLTHLHVTLRSTCPNQVTKNASTKAEFRHENWHGFSAHIKYFYGLMFGPHI